MTSAVLDPPPATTAPGSAVRAIGRYSAGRPGPRVVLIGSIHGNEPAGSEAIRAVLSRLSEARLPLAGDVSGLVGNVGALAAGQRFLARDLNRGWSASEVEAAIAAQRLPEDEEQVALLREIAAVVGPAREPVVFLDLHSTSGDGPPFICMADVLRNRPIAMALPIPLILGIEEILDGSLMGWLCDIGHVALGVEGGRNDDPRTVRNLEAVIWIALAACGALDAAAVPDMARHRASLVEAARGLPQVLEVRHRHLIRTGDDFVMGPDWASFQPVQRGQAVATDRHGPIRSPETGLMLMPRYQGQGDDGYFLAGVVSPFWLWLSAALRHARLDRLVALLPGVHRHPLDPDRLVVDPTVARWQVRNVFHLFGYRHERAHGDSLVFSRRTPAFRGGLPLELAEL